MNRTRIRLLATLTLASAVACGLPTDEHADLGVTFLVDEVSMVLGERIALDVEVVGASGIGVMDVSFSSFDEAIVRPAEGGELLAVGTGEAQVEVSLTSFEGAGTDTVRVLVLKDIAFDAVSPDTVSFGDVLTIVGSALDPARLSVLSVGGWVAQVHSFVPGDPSAANPRDTLRLWVPPGPRPESRVVALHGAGGTASWPVTVRQQDLYEPNDTIPTVIADPFSLTNPQLAFEVDQAFDWYRMTNLPDTFTIILDPRFPGVEGVAGAFELSAPRARRGDVPDWSIPYFEKPRCHGLEVQRDRSIFLDTDGATQRFYIPVMGTAGDSVDLTVQMPTAPAEPQSYSVRVVEGYRTVLAPDAFEPNNHCEQAFAFNGSLYGPLTLDHGLDMDWFRFSVEGQSRAVSVTVECPACASELRFIDITIFRDADTGTTEKPEELPVVWTSYSSDVVHRVNTVVPPGDYFILIHNEFSDPVPNLTLQVTIG